MTTQEHELRILGGNTIINGISTIIISTGYGAMVLMMFVAMHYLSKKRRTIPVVALATCCIMIFVLFTMQYIYYSGVNLLVIAADTDEPPQQTASYERTEHYLAYMALSPSQPGLMFLLGDVIVVWRAWVLLPTDKIYKILLSALILANSGIIVADTVLDNIQIQSETRGIVVNMDWVVCIGSLLVNLCATLLVGWKLWTHQRSVKYLPARRGHQIQKIMVIFIESGAIMSVAQVMNLAFTTAAATGNFNPTPGFLFAYHAFTSLAVVATAWYPLAVIILVNTGNSPVNVTVHFTESDLLQDPQSIYEQNLDGIHGTL